MIKFSNLDDDLPFGARVSGVTLDLVGDAGFEREIREVFHDRGMIVFEDVEPSNDMQFAISNIFGPPQQYALKEVSELDDKRGLIDLNYEGNIVDADGTTLVGWIPWHFDSCYTAKLNRGGVLRAIVIPPEGGLTGFADGIQIYDALPHDLRARFEDRKIVYHSKAMFANQRFGVPQNYTWTNISDVSARLIAGGETAPRSVHPAIWQRDSGEHVVHVSPWQAVGIEGEETPEGDALLETLCREIYDRMKPYWHDWRPTDMLIWDNWRFIHSASGYKPEYPRRMHRTTITGDYGLGRFELEDA